MRVAIDGNVGFFFPLNAIEYHRMQVWGLAAGRRARRQYQSQCQGHACHCL